MAKFFCPTCGASGIDPCLTASGKPARKMHKDRVVIEVRKTQKQRFDEMVAERRSNDAEARIERAKKRQAEASLFGLPFAKSDPDEPKPVPNRAIRRSHGFYKTVHRGAAKRRRKAKVTAEIAVAFQPPMADWERELLETTSV